MSAADFSELHDPRRVLAEKPHLTMRRGRWDADFAKYVGVLGFYVDVVIDRNTAALRWCNERNHEPRPFRRYPNAGEICRAHDAEAIGLRWYPSP